MEKKFKLKGLELCISHEDVIKAAQKIEPGSNSRVKFYAVIDGNEYPVRMLAVMTIRLLGQTIPDITTHQAINIIRSLGFEIREI